MANGAPPFWLEHPVDVPFHINDVFNAPRDYSHRPDKLQLHEGVDLRGLNNAGQPGRVLAAQRGIVELVGFSPKGYGNYVRLLHQWHDGEIYATWYGHMSQVTIGEGSYVNAGDQLGVVGSSGFSSGPHLHITLQHLGHGLPNYVVDDVVDPLPFIRTAGPMPLFDELDFVEDVTVPDGTIMQPGQAFIKQWRIRNTGNLTWQPGYVLVHAGIDDPMGGPASLPLPPLRPGETAVIELPLVAPGSSNRHRSTWQMRNAQGQLRPFTIYAEVQVAAARPFDRARYLEDVTVPDGTPMSPGASFTKRWRVKNAGNTTWSPNYQIAFAGDEQMDGLTVAPLGRRVLVGQEAVVSVALTAPQAPGTHRSSWRLRNEQGQFFDDNLFAEIVVTPHVDDPRQRHDDLKYVDDVTIQDGTLVQPGQLLHKVWRIRNAGTHPWDNHTRLAFVSGERMGAPAEVALPPASPGEIVDVAVDFTAPAAAQTHTTAWQAKDPAGRPFGDTLTAVIVVPQVVAGPGAVDDAKFDKDVTIPDGTVIQPGSSFRKTWRIKNAGTTTWSAGYTLQFVGNEQMEAPPSVPLPFTQPGQLAELSVDLVAPLVPGAHRSTWQAANAQGQLFGHRVFAEITVPQASVASGSNNARLVSHETVPNQSTISPGATFEKVWRVRNTGESTWGPGYSLVNIGGNRMNAPESVPVPQTKPQKIASISILLTAPTQAQATAHRGIWKLRDPEGRTFGPLLFASIIVEGNTVDMAPFLHGDGRMYEIKHLFVIDGQQEEGQERVQTQTDEHNANHFFHVKNGQWEELWVEGDFIYRGTDTSPGEGLFYHLSENNRHGSPWIPRHMSPGTAFRRSPVVTFQRKDNCALVNQFTHVTWIKLEEVLDQITLPHADPQVIQPGMTVQDVAVLAAFHDNNNQPGEEWFERYYYAQRYGLVMWEGRGHINGRSWMVEEHAPGARPPMPRETVACAPQKQ